jgi:ketosteroid isomerase-like protein
MKMVPVLLAITCAAACSPPAPDADAGGAPEASAPEPAPDASVLMEADRAFAAAVAEGGSEAWASWFAEDGAMIQPRVGEIRGRADIRGYVTWLDDPQVSLRWEPARADIAASGDLGWTTGRFVSEGVDDNGQPTRGEGRYVSIWRRAADGSWKVVMDLGNPTSARPAAV